MSKLVNPSPLEEIENPNLWQYNLNTLKNNFKNIFKETSYIKSGKILSHNFDVFYDNVINGDLYLDTEPKMNNNSFKKEKQFVYSDEPFEEAIYITEGNIINNNFLPPYNDIYLTSNYYKNNSYYLKYVNDSFGDIFDSKFEKAFLKIFKKANSNTISFDLEKEIYFLQDKKQNIVSLNQAKKKLFLINKFNQADKKNTNLYNEKAEEKKESINFPFIIDENGKTVKKDIHFIGKKRKLFNFLSEKRFNIFNYGEYDNYSKRMINEALNENNKKSDNLFVVKYSKKTRKRLKNITKRKFNSDLIRKKIKNRFYKYLKDSINEKLKLAGSKKKFTFLPQSFISNIAKKYNLNFLNLTFKEILAKNLCLGKDNKKSELKKYHHNLSILEYLEKNKKISRKSNFNNIKNMKLHEIYDEYLNSIEFQMEISKLKQQKETDKYIKKYIIRAINLIDYFYY